MRKYRTTTLSLTQPLIGTHDSEGVKELVVVVELETTVDVSLVDDGVSLVDDGVWLVDEASLVDDGATLVEVEETLEEVSLLDGGVVVVLDTTVEEEVG